MKFKRSDLLCAFLFLLFLPFFLPPPTFATPETEKKNSNEFIEVGGSEALTAEGVIFVPWIK